MLSGVRLAYACDGVCFCVCIIRAHTCTTSSEHVYLFKSNPPQVHLTCHKSMHMEEGHDQVAPVLGRQIVGGNDIGKGGG
jgi:hypothetical protein